MRHLLGIRIHFPFEWVNFGWLRSYYECGMLWLFYRPFSLFSALKFHFAINFFVDFLHYFCFSFSCSEFVWVCSLSLWRLTLNWKITLIIHTYKYLLRFSSPYSLTFIDWKFTSFSSFHKWCTKLYKHCSI